MITVDYPPGGTDPVHRHNASAFVYVLEGSIVMQMKGGEKVTLHPGDTFYEDPAGIHLVGKNASGTKPAKFLVLESGTVCRPGIPEPQVGWPNQTGDRNHSPSIVKH